MKAVSHFAERTGTELVVSDDVDDEDAPDAKP